jgi:hypothetical protein
LVSGASFSFSEQGIIAILSERDWKNVEEAAQERKDRRKTYDLQAYMASSPPASE